MQKITSAEFPQALVNRAAITEAFTVNSHGRIMSLGKFAGQRLYVPYFWNKVIEGWQDDEDEDGTPVFYVTEEDRAEFPEIPRKVSQIRLVEQEDGGVIER